MPCNSSKTVSPRNLIRKLHGQGNDRIGVLGGACVHLSSRVFVLRYAVALSVKG